MRGTPILLQLFVLYYGIAAAIRLPAFAAALLGLALNYAAYESEIYRSALEAVSLGQIEAARTLGLSERQVLRLVRGPQAFRLALAPMTNDFVALLKDSSLVSVLTVLELTKETQIFATNLGSWVVPGTMCAALYLAMSLPVAAAARRLERRWSFVMFKRSRSARARRATQSRRSAILDGVSLDANRGEPSPSWDQLVRGRRRCSAPSPASSVQAGHIALDGVAQRTGASAYPPRLCRQSGWCFSSIVFEHLSALDNVCLAPVRTASRRGCRTARSRAARRLRRRAPCAGAARNLSGGGRGVAIRARSPSIRRSADGRTDRVARSRAAVGARRADAQPHRGRPHPGHRDA
jgi:polar amino acid transport system substrate-binding protein